MSRRDEVADRVKSWALPVAAAVLAVGFGVASISNGLAQRDRTSPASDQSMAAGQGPAAGQSPTAGQGTCAAPDRAGLVPAQGTLFGVNLDTAAKPLSQFAADL
ncbi:hypothetical protein [Arthrobacter sp. C152]